MLVKKIRPTQPLSRPTTQTVPLCIKEMVSPELLYIAANNVFFPPQNRLENLVMNTNAITAILNAKTDTRKKTHEYLTIR